ncbi:ornithine-acyl[acyl carrier protein] N-acyltransferase [Fluviicoccus keumensis]|uniref:L-ornithine N(alpha)-acyltransferase n=1 Tax=Fluviicoccus keumensis TaxID=1435465 RepID=A0A4V2G603_9GAMM|nr:GNAT family N-acyltransferase [Fluviicoccus keumensis]RZU46796.1 ornithine-acyl[acyl carrier protein] N-acyltransferase [Fluviicoccus keumensis]
MQTVSMSAQTAMPQPEASGIRTPRFVARFAQGPREVQAAQRLRAEVFSAEYGVSFAHPQGLDCDRFDPYCRHLNVFDTRNGQLVATTRLLPGEATARTGGFYSAAEFDLTPLLPNLQGRVLEIGRTCVHPEYRSGAAITVMWSALAEFLMEEDFAYLIGCASIGLAEDATRYHAIVGSLQEEQFVPPEWRVRPRQRIPALPTLCGDVSASLPPLLKAYLRMNAKIGGEGSLDPEFNCADMFIVLDVSALAGRYAQRFLKAA